MPQLVNPQSNAANPDVLAATTAALRVYAARALAQEAAIVVPNVGYKAYNKRMAFARAALNNAEVLAKSAAVLLEQAVNGLQQEATNNGISIYNYINSQNAMGGASLFDAEAGFSASQNNVGTTSGHSIFDVLAGVDQSDLQ